jgi:hypothetical protein
MRRRKIWIAAAKSRSTGLASDLIIRERTFKLRRFLPGTENAESLVLLARKGKARRSTAEIRTFTRHIIDVQDGDLRALELRFAVPILAENS